MTRDILLSVLDYSPETGALLWKRRTPDMFNGNAAKCAGWNTRYAGRPALQCLDSEGYQHGSVLGRDLKAHRVAWIITHNEEPGALDHINRDKSDNRIANLREVSGTENQRNMPIRRDNSSGVPGVGLCKGSWRARITLGGAEYYLGSFATFEQAVAARREAEAKHGFHENHGKQLENA